MTSGGNDVESGKGRIYFNNRKEDIMFTRLRIGHSGLNNSLFTLGKHQSGGLCETCSETDTIEHVFLQCAVDLYIKVS